LPVYLLINRFYSVYLVTNLFYSVHLRMLISLDQFICENNPSWLDYLNLLSIQALLMIKFSMAKKNGILFLPCDLHR